MIIEDTERKKLKKEKENKSKDKTSRRTTREFII